MRAAEQRQCEPPRDRRMMKLSLLSMALVTALVVRCTVGQRFPVPPDIPDRQEPDGGPKLEPFEDHGGPRLIPAELQPQP
ncbi:unnamed protein product [Darwinula stevensoni]|uniref:Uncharacterized protein n=1 Tax=Darwinula stevensoni TaxID=69355 RepID=A0A7R8XIX7_9CRUS|nr:unnamed protein product [Darwinula stevensoni]CAG0891686.1 unnamed protein product [Darwinula stevensoni]